MTEKQKNKLITYLSAAIILLIIVCVFINNYHNNKNKKQEEEKIRSDERIKSLEKEISVLKPQYDSLKSEGVKKEAIIEYQKKNPQIIHEKYVEIRNGVFSLDVDSKISYLSNRLSEKNNLR